MPVDPQIAKLLELRAALPTLHTLSVADARAQFGARNIPGLKIAEVASVVDRDMQGPGGSLGLRIYTPQGDGPFPLMVFYHGSGFVVCSLDTHDAMCRNLCAGTGCVVVSVDYRLAPEHKFPAAPDDCLAATRWAVDNAGALRADTSRLVLAGDSAGGNLSAVVAQQTRIAGTRMPDFQLLLYPVTDLSRSFPSHEMFAEGYYLTLPLMRWFADHYLGDAGKARDPMASPLLQADLSGLPPAFLATAGWDVLRDEGRAYAERLLEAGVAVEYRNYDRLIHGYFSMGGVVREASRAFDDAVAALRGGLGVD